MDDGLTGGSDTGHISDFDPELTEDHPNDPKNDDDGHRLLL